MVLFVYCLTLSLDIKNVILYKLKTDVRTYSLTQSESTLHRKSPSSSLHRKGKRSSTLSNTATVYLERYRIIELVAGGGEAVVFKIEDLNRNKAHFALKRYCDNE